MQTLWRRGGRVSQGNMGVGHGLIRMCRTHVFDAVHATVVPSLLLSQDADHGRSCAGSRLPRLPGAELQGQSHHNAWVDGVWVDGNLQVQEKRNR